VANGIVLRWGWMTRKTDLTIQPPTITIDQSGPGTGFYAYVYGDIERYQVAINANNLFVLTAVAAPFAVNDMLVTDPTDESLDMIIELQALNITFLYSNVDPEIIKVNEHEDSLEVIYKARGQSEGKCYLGANNGITPSVLVDVYKHENNYLLPITPHRFEGKVIVSLVCSQNSDTFSMNINVRRGDLDIDKGTISDSEIRKNSIRQHDDDFKWWIDFGYPQWVNKSISIGIYILSGIVILFLVVYVFWPMFKLLWNKCFGPKQVQYYTLPVSFQNKML